MYNINMETIPLFVAAELPTSEGTRGGGITSVSTDHTYNYRSTFRTQTMEWTHCQLLRLNGTPEMTIKPYLPHVTWLHRTGAVPRHQALLCRLFCGFDSFIYCQDVIKRKFCPCSSLFTELNVPFSNLRMTFHG